MNGFFTKVEHAPSVHVQVRLRRIRPDKETAFGAAIQEITRVSAAAHAAYPAHHGPAPAVRVREVVLHQPKGSLPSRRPRPAAGSSQAERASQQASCVRRSLCAPWFTSGYAYVPVVSSFPLWSSIFTVMVAPSFVIPRLLPISPVNEIAIDPKTRISSRR